MPEPDEVDVKIEDKDLRIDVFRSSGPGGQSVNTTDSAVRITHIPTGIVVSQQDQKSQLQNKLRGMQVLRARLFDHVLQQQEAARARLRKTAVGTGDRSAKIRTYNFPQNRVTDHRIGLTLHDLPGVLDGDIGALLEGLRLAADEEKMAMSDARAMEGGGMTRVRVGAGPAGDAVGDMRGDTVGRCSTHCRRSSPGRSRPPRGRRRAT